MFEILHSKIHRAVVTDANLDYEGSITLSSRLMKAAGIEEYQKVLIADVDNGNRFETYVIKSDENNVVCINGSAARLVSVGDKVIIMAFKLVESMSDKYTPLIVHVDEENNIRMEFK